MNNLNILKKFIGLVAILFANLIFADQGAVTFSNTQTFNNSVTSKAIVYDGNNSIYVANGTNGILVLYDNNMSQKLTQIVGSGKDIIDLAIDENFVYLVSSDSYIYTLEINNGGLINEHNISINGDINDIKVKSNYIYIANGVNGLKIVDARDKSSMSLDGLVEDTDYDAKKIMIKDDVLFLADGWGGLKTINISSLDNPTIVNQIDGNFNDIAIDNNKLFGLRGDDNRLNAYDITNTILPIFKSETTLTGTNTNIYAYDSNVYVAQSNVIKAYQTIDMTSLAENGDYNNASNINDFMIDNANGYISNTTSIIKAVFQSDLPNTYTLATTNTAISLDYTDNTTPAIKRVGLFPKNKKDIDIIKVNVKTGVLTLDINTKADLNCTILDENNQTINSDLNNSNIKDFATNVFAGDYYIKIQPSSDNTVNSIDYDVTISLFKDAQANTISVASIINFDETITGDIVTSSDKDVFKVFVSTPGKLKVSSSALQLITKLYNNKTDMNISSSGTLETGGVVFDVTHSGYYFIELGSDQNQYPYTFTASFIPNSIGEYRDDNKPSLKELYSDTKSVYSIALDASNIYFGTNTDISKNSIDTTISPINSTTTNLQANDIEVIGDYSYAVFDSGKISKYKITGNTVELKSSLDLNSSLSKVIVDGNYIYTFTGSKLYKVNVSGNALLLEEAFDSGENINDIALKYSVWNKNGALEKTRNSYIYLATNNGLKVYSVDEQNLLTIYNTDTTTISKLSIDNSRLYMTRSNKLKIYDISVPVYASLLGEVDISNSSDVTDIAIDSNHIYLTPNLRVVDISDETKPKVVNQKNSLLSQKSIVIRDDIAYTANGSDVNLYEVRYDYGDTNTTAKEININKSTLGNISNIVNQYSGTDKNPDIDYFRLNITTSGTLNLNLSTSSNLNYSSTNLGASTEISPGVYYIKVQGDSVTDDGDYNLTNVFVKDDHSDTPDDATTLVLNTTDTNNTLFSTGDDTDWFKIVLEQRGEVEILTTVNKDLNTTTKIELYYDDKTTEITKVGFNADSYADNNSTSYDYKVNTTLNPGTYYIKITGGSIDSSKNIGDYNLTTTYTKTDDFVLENGFDGISDYNIASIAYGNKNIFTITNDAKIVTYNHLLKKLGTKSYGGDVNLICDKQFISNEYFYINTKDSSNAENCTGYQRISTDTMETEESNSMFVNYRNYEYDIAKYLKNISDIYIGDYIRSMALKDNYLFVASDDKILTYDISNKQNPQLKALYGRHNTNKFYKDGGYTYIVDSSVGLFIYDSNDTLTSSYIIPDSNIENVVVDGDNTFVLTRNNGLMIFDTSDKTAPILKKTLTHNNSMHDMKIDGNYLYIARWQGMSIVNLVTLEFVGDYNSKKDDFRSLNIDSNDAYLTGNNGLEVIDISNKTAPTLKLHYPLVNNSDAIASDGTKIYIEDNDDLKVIDKSKLLANLTSKNETSLSKGISVNYTTFNKSVGDEDGSNTYSEIGDYEDTNISLATTIEPNSIISASLSAGDNDIIKIIIDSNVTLNIYTSSAMDTYGSIYDSNGTELINNDDSGESQNFAISYNVAPGIYYIKTKGFSENITGNYLLHVEAGISSLVGDTMVNNVNIRDILLPAKLEGTSKSGDYDYYKFTLNSSMYLHFDYSNVNLNVYTSTGDNQSINNQYSAGTYYIKVYGYTYDSTTYNIKISQTSSYYDSLSHLASKGDKISGTFDNGDEDWYKINLASNTDLDILLNSDTYSYLTLYNSDGNYVTSNSDNYYSGINRTLNAGAYYIKVHNYDWQTSSYTLRIKDTAIIDNSNISNIDGLDINGSGLIVTNGATTKIYDENNLSSKLSETTLILGNTNLNINQIETIGSSLYVQHDSNNSVDIYDISSPTAISRTNQNVGGSVNDGFTTSKTVGLYRYDLSSPYFTKYYLKDINNQEWLENVSVGSSSQFIFDNSNSYAYFKEGNQFKIVDLNSIHYESTWYDFGNIYALNADNNYIYEYGEKQNVSQSYNKYILRSSKNSDDTSYARTAGIYQIDNVDILEPKDSLALVANSNNLSIIDFSSSKVGVLKSTEIFDANITLMKVHPTLNIVYVYMKDATNNNMQIFNFDDPSSLINIPLSLAEPMIPDINSIHIVDNKFFVSSAKFGIQGMHISDTGDLSNCKTLENIGINVQNVFSMDGSTVNYTSSKTKNDINKSRDDLNVFFLRKDDIIDGNTDTLYNVQKDAPSEGCFIATAAYGSYFETHVKVLRDFRDNYLLTNAIGKKFVKLYYTYSPSIARNIAQNEWAKGIIRVTLTPIVYAIKYPLYALLLLMMLLLIPIIIFSNNNKTIRKEI